MDACACMCSTLPQEIFHVADRQKTQLIWKRSISPSNSHKIAKTFTQDYPVSGEVCTLSCHANANLLQDVESMGL